MRSLLALGFLFLLSGVFHANAQTVHNREALRGLNGVGVLLNADDDKLKEIDYSVDQLGTDVELRLRKARIPVFDGQTVKPVKGVPRLAVVVSILILEDGSVVFDTNARLLQWVNLQRQQNGDSLYLPTWTAKGIIGIGPKGKIRETIRQAVADTLDVFVNDYLAANPKTTR